MTPQAATSAPAAPAVVVSIIFRPEWTAAIPAPSDVPLLHHRLRRGLMRVHDGPPVPVVGWDLGGEMYRIDTEKIAHGLAPSGESLPEGTHLARPVPGSFSWVLPLLDFAGRPFHAFVRGRVARWVSEELKVPLLDVDGCSFMPGKLEAALREATSEDWQAWHEGGPRYEQEVEPEPEAVALPEKPPFAITLAMDAQNVARMVEGHAGDCACAPCGELAELERKLREAGPVLANSG